MLDFIYQGVDSATMEQEQVSRLRLADGRMLAWEECGDRNGYPIFYFHNHGSSRKEARLLHRGARECGFRLIAVDRPGIGCSDPNPRMQHRDFADDVAALAASLSLVRYGLMSWAGGAPFAFSLAGSRPESVSLLVALAPVPVQEQQAVGRVKHALFLRLLRTALMLRHRFSLRSAASHLSSFRDTLCQADRQQLQRKGIVQCLLQDQEEALRQGYAGVAADTCMSLAAWPVLPEQIEVPVQLWHGTADTVIPVHYSEQLAARLRECSLRRVGRQGHFFFVQESREIFVRARAELMGTLLCAGSANSWNLAGKGPGLIAPLAGQRNSDQAASPVRGLLACGV